MSDADSIFTGYAQDPEVCRYVPWKPHRSIADTETFLRGAVEALAGTVRSPWVITLPPADEAIGMIELRPANPFSTMGYVLRRSAWGQGLTTEGVRAVMAAAFTLPDLWRVSAYCDADNRASARVMEKVGMSLEGRLRRFCGSQR
jgi:RimJ/RimL family protein N-acetyltransferase